MEIGTLDDLAERLSSAIVHEPDRRIIWVTGSGLSAPIVPSTSQMIDFFRAALGEPEPTSGVAVSSPDEYRRLASRLKLRKGASALSAVVRDAVLRAFNGDVGHDLPDPDHPGWNVPPQQIALAKIVGLIPEYRRGPIITTNFDTLTEAALCRAGIEASALSAAGLSPVGFEVPVGVLPVVHIHGVWNKGLTLSTDSELQFDREVLESQIASIFENSLVICVGYGGWEDSFTRSLASFLQSSRMNLADSELLWLHHRNHGDTGLIAQVRGASVVSEYSEISMEALTAHLAERVRAALRPRIPSVPGISLVPDSFPAPLDRRAARKFVDGVQPTFAIAAVAPILSGSEKLRQSVLNGASGDAVIVAVGPTGEGKSLALYQAALAVQKKVESAGGVVVYLEPGSRIPEVEELAEFRRRFRVSYIFADEADLVISGLVGNIRDSRGPNGSICTVLAMHSQYSHKMEWERSRASESWSVVEFGGLTCSDSLSLASFWNKSGLLPDSYATMRVEDLAALIENCAAGVGESSLFGAVLHLWDGEDLLDRISDLLERLDRMNLGGISFRRILEGIALVHHSWMSDDEVFSEGLPENAIAVWCGVSSQDIVRLVLRPLGREAAITTVGSDIFIRHPSIATAVVSEMSELDLISLASELGRVGGLMRVSERFSARSHILTTLARRLRGDAAVACALAAMKSSQLLESRVTYMSILRQENRSESARQYAIGAAAHIEEFPDFVSSCRGFFVEWSVNERNSGHFVSAIQASCRSLSDISPRLYPPQIEQIRYGLVNVYLSLEKAGRREAPLAVDCLDILRICPNGSDILHFVRDRPIPAEVVHSLVARFRQHSLEYAGRTAPNHWRFRGFLESLSRLDVRKSRQSDFGF